MLVPDVSYPSPNPSPMDYSTATAVLSCQERAHLRHLLKRGDPAPSTALRFGEVWHRAHEIRALQYDNGVPPTAIMSSALEKAQWQDTDDYRNAGKLILGFNAWSLRAEAKLWTPIKTEMGFSLPIDGAAEPLEGRIDGLVQYDNGLWILDYKTTSRLDADWVALHRLSYQFKWYLYAARRLFPGEEIKGVIVDVYHATKGVKKGATPEEVAGNRFYTQYFEYSDAILNEAIEDFKQATWIWQRAKDDQVFPRNTSACMQYGRPCEFLEVCLAEPSLRASHLEGFPEYTFNPLQERV